MAIVKVTRREYHIIAQTYEEQRRFINHVLALAERDGASPLAVVITAGAGEAHLTISYDGPLEDVHV